MDHSLTKCNLQNEMSSIKKKIVTNVTSVEQDVSFNVGSDEDSDKNLPSNSNPNKLLTDSRGNLRVAMLKQAKLFNQSFKTVPSNIINGKKLPFARKIPPPSDHAFAIQSMHQHSKVRIEHQNDLHIRKTSIDIEMTELEDHKKEHNNLLNTSKNAITSNSTEVQSTVMKEATNSEKEKAYVISEKKIVTASKSPLVVRKPTNTMNGMESHFKKMNSLVVKSPIVIPKQKTSTEQNANKSLVKPKSYQANDVIHKAAEQTVLPKFPKSLTVKSIPTSEAESGKLDNKPFKAKIGGRVVTLRRLNNTAPVSRDMPSTSKQQAPKICVRKSSDGTYKVSTAMSATNTNVISSLVKNSNSKIQNAEHKKVEPLLVDSSDEDNQPCTSKTAMLRVYKRKKATSTVTSDVPKNEIRDDEQFRSAVPTKQSKLDTGNTLQKDKVKRVGIMNRRNTCYVPFPKESETYVNVNVRERVNEIVKPKRQNGITTRRNTCYMSDHNNYTMPQNLVKPSKEDVRNVPASRSEVKSKQSGIKITSTSNEDDLFMIQDDSSSTKRKVPMNNSGSSKRKSFLEPIDTFDEDSHLERIKESHDLPLRPRQNIQLIESLARYRTIVKFLLNRLEIQQIDFNNDDYINLYKIYRG
ncbi:unnamed protein product [Diamesa hyperborea]